MIPKPVLVYSKIENLGIYKAKSEKINAELNLKIEKSWCNWYLADIKFYTDQVYSNDKEGFSVSIHTSSNQLKGIFERLKRSETGIENLLATEVTSQKWDEWQGKRNVMKCIFSLEDQTKHI